MAKLNEGTEVGGELAATEKETGVPADRFDSITSALDYAQLNGINRVYLPAGTYQDGDLGPADQIDYGDASGDDISGVELVGASRTSTVLKSTSARVLRARNDGNVVRNVTLESEADEAVAASSISDWLFENVTIANSDGVGAIQVGGTSEYNHWQNLTILDSSGDGVRHEDSTVQHNYYSGIDVRPLPGTEINWGNSSEKNILDSGQVGGDFLESTDGDNIVSDDVLFY